MLVSPVSFAPRRRAYIHGINSPRSWGAGEALLIMPAYKDQARRGEVLAMEDRQAKNPDAFTRNKLCSFFGDRPQSRLKAGSRPKACDGLSHLPGKFQCTPSRSMSPIGHAIKTLGPNETMSATRETDHNRAELITCIENTSNTDNTSSISARQYVIGPLPRGCVA